MKILQVGACPLTNQEVHSIVNEEFMSLEARSKLMSINKTESRDSHFDLERQRTSARNVLEYLKHGNPEFSHLDKAAMNAFLAKIADMPLTDAEVVQILNLMPSEADIFYGICRDNNRLTDDQIKAICALVNHHFLGGPPPPSAAPSEAPIASPLTSRQRDILALEEGAVAAVPMASPLTLEEAPPGKAAAENSVQQAPSAAPSEAPSGGAATAESLSTAPPQSPSQAVLSSVAATGAPKEVVAGPPASHESQPATKKGRPAGRKKKAENSVQQAPSAAPSEAPSGNVANPAESAVQQAVSGDPATSSRLRKARRPKDAATAGSLSTAPPQAPSQAVLSSAAATGAPKEVVAELPASHESQQATESGRLAGRKKKRRVAQEDATTAN